MDGSGHRMDTEARGIPAVTATRTLVTAPWTSSRTKVRREAAARLAKLQSVGLDGTEWHMPKAVVPKANPRKRMTTNKVTVYIDPNVIKRDIAQSGSAEFRHDYTQG
jgi:hypothetical protein